MAVPNSSFNALLTTTFERVRNKMADNLSTHSVVLSSIERAGGKRTEEGGESIRENILYGANSTVASYAGGEVLDTTPQEGITAATYDWKQLYGTVYIPNIDVFKNSGRAKIVSLLETKIKQLEISFMEEVDSQLLGDGTGNDGKDILGLAALVEDGTAWSTVGSIDSNTWTFWRNQYLDFTGAGYTTFGTAAKQSTQGLYAMRLMRDACRRKGDYPNLILTTPQLRRAYEADAEGAKLRLSADQKLVDLGFDNTVFSAGGKAIPIVDDDGVTDGYMWWLNTNWLHFVVGRGHDFRSTPFVEPVDQDVQISKQLLYCATTTSNRARQGLIVNFADDEL